MREGFFEGVEKQSVTLSSGQSIDLPFKYYDWSEIYAAFPASYKGAERMLPSEKLKPLKITPGKTIIQITAFAYHKAEGLQPYNEFVISIPVQYEPSSNFPGKGVIYFPLYWPERYEKFGLYIAHIPVTTQEAVPPGVEIYGFQTSVEDIEFTDTHRSRRCTLRSNGKDVVSFEVRKSKTMHRRIQYHLYTVKSGQLLRSLVDTEGEYAISRMPGGASFELGEGQIADELRGLDIGKTAVGHIYATSVQSMLHPPGEYLEM